MQEKILKFAYACLVASISILILIAVLLFAWYAEEATPWTEMKASDWGVWVGGLGTIATLIGTIRIATSADRRQRREQLDSALITAAEVTLWIADLRRSIQSARKQLPLALNALDDTKAACSQVLVTVENVGLLQREQIAQLVSVPNHTAARLAWSTTKLRSTLGNVRRIRDAEVIKEEVTPRFTQLIDHQFLTIATELEQLENECLKFLRDHGFGGNYLSNNVVNQASGAAAPQ
jgi:hypothetical protein